MKNQAVKKTETEYYQATEQVKHHPSVIELSEYIGKNFVTYYLRRVPGDLAQ